MPALARLFAYYILFQSMIGAVAFFAYRSGYFWDTPAQAQLREPEFRSDKNIGYLVRHGGIIGDAVWLSLLAAFVMALYADKWNYGIFVSVFLLAAAVMFPVQKQWLQESFAVPSALGRDGRMTVEAYIHYAYAVLLITIFVMFSGTPGVEPWHVWVVAALLMGHVAVGVLQPVYSSTGTIPLKTWIIFGAAEGLVVVLAGGRAWVAGRYGW